MIYVFRQIAIGLIIIVALSGCVEPSFLTPYVTTTPNPTDTPTPTETPTSSVSVPISPTLTTLPSTDTPVSPSLTFTNIPTPSNTPVPEPRCQTIVDSVLLKDRPHAREAGRIVTTLSTGTILIPLAQNPERTWLKVSLEDGTPGWVLLNPQWIVCTYIPDNLGIEEGLPPLPTYTSTPANTSTPTNTSIPTPTDTPIPAPTNTEPATPTDTPTITPVPVRDKDVIITVNRLQATSSDSCNERMDFYGSLQLGSASQSFPIQEGNDISPGWSLQTFVTGATPVIDGTIRVRDEDDALCGGGDDNVDINPSPSESQVTIRIFLESNEVWLLKEGSPSQYIGMIGTPIILQGFDDSETGIITFQVNLRLR